MALKTGKGYKLSDSESLDYYFLIAKHVDRLSETLQSGLDVGEINTAKLVGYYVQLRHLEGLLVPFCGTTQFFQRRDYFLRRVPSIATTWSGNLNKQIEFYNALLFYFKLLIAYAYNEGVFKIRKRSQFNINDDIL